MLRLFRNEIIASICAFTFADIYVFRPQSTVTTWTNTISAVRTMIIKNNSSTRVRLCGRACRERKFKYQKKAWVAIFVSFMQAPRFCSVAWRASWAFHFSWNFPTTKAVRCVIHMLKVEDSRVRVGGFAVLVCIVYCASLLLLLLLCCCNCCCCPLVVRQHPRKLSSVRASWCDKYEVLIWRFSCVILYS